MNKKTTSLIFWIIITIIPIAGLVLGVVNPEVFQQSQDILQSKIIAYGIWAISGVTLIGFISIWWLIRQRQSNNRLLNENYE
ncbi:MAG: hypothetical protein U9M89_00500 [Patescibacteria group bacterium]|nr:hypothetical protein [Patescibacteria group bacterium]